MTDHLAAHRRNVRFELMADASPGLLPRILAPLARRDLTPDRLRSRLSGAVMLVEFDLDGVPSGEVDMVEGNLRQIVGMSRVSVQWRAAVRAA